ncbi:MAG: phage holin family protein [Bacteroidales bacterium]|nr:phage holin family protein [Bacteroidales bacterium]
MRKWIINLLISAIAVYFAAWLLKGIHIGGFVSAIFVALVLGFLNRFIKPVLQILTIPITIITLGIFLIILNVLMIYLTAWFIPGFSIDGFWSALFFALIVGFINSLLKDND